MAPKQLQLNDLCQPIDFSPSVLVLVLAVFFVTRPLLAYLTYPMLFAWYINLSGRVAYHDANRPATARSLPTTLAFNILRAMDEVPSISALRAGASALVSAAELLAQLAATISETAQTLSTAVELLSNTSPEFKLPQDSAPANINQHSKRVSDQTSSSSPTQNSPVTTTKPRQPYQ